MPIPRMEIDSLLAAISALPSRACLDTVCLEADRGCDVLPCDDAGALISKRLPNGWRCIPKSIDEEALCPLFALPMLTDIMLRISCPFDVDDALLDKCFVVAGALASSSASRHGACCTKVTSSKAVLWLDVRTIINVLGFELNADLSILPRARFEKRPMLGAPHRPLKTLNVGHSPIEDPYAVAAFLADSFPWLDDIQNSWENMAHDWYDGDDYDGVDEVWVEPEWWSTTQKYRIRWKRVSKLVPMFASIRAQER
ncbi:hypothetical protein C8Q79DRAFT_1008306 [Trametes meyenii]|nr:hypothetical protein C8Q79DRAFT_1008306 [Trametes meyenii]